ncbi:MAG TPA: DUF2069 domain-containing protein [Steroidobacteraceae bacterium]|nr:DUF2069 domain-containing protein [Steroidobacteraceae bacterium]
MSEAGPARATRAARAVVAALVALLCFDYLGWHLTRLSPPAASLACVVGLAPWICVAPSLWRGERRRYAIATLLTAPYLGYGVMEFLANRGARTWALGLALLSIVLFVALIGYLRLSRPAAAAPSARTAP